MKQAASCWAKSGSGVLCGALSMAATPAPLSMKVVDCGGGQLQPINSTVSMSLSSCPLEPFQGYNYEVARRRSEENRTLWMWSLPRPHRIMYVMAQNDRQGRKIT